MLATHLQKLRLEQQQKLEGLILVDWQLVSNINGYKKSTLKVESLKNKDGQRLKNLQKN